MEPVQVIRLGLIKCEIFVRSTRVGDRHHAVFHRLYKNGPNWAQSVQFGRDDLLQLSKVADLAHSWIFLHNQTDDVAEVQEQSS